MLPGALDPQMCRLDLELTSPRPNADRCQAILNDFLAPLGAESSKCDFEQPSMVWAVFAPQGVPKLPLFGAFAAPGDPLGPPSGHQGCQLSDVSATLGAKLAKM